MNNEIKEILEMLRKYGSTNDKVLLDFITNLQQENERLKGISYNPEETNNKWVEEESELRKVFRERKDYKSRCEKAIDKLSFIDEALESNTLNVPLCITKINSALNILQNGSDS